MRFKHTTLAAVFDMVYLGLMTNALLVLGCLPLVAGVLVTDPAKSWPLLAVVAPLCAPGLCAVFAVLAQYSAHRSTTVVATFFQSWRATWRRAMTLGALASAAVVVLGVDIRAAWGHQAGAVAIPVLAVALVLVAAASLLALVALAERPTVRLRDVLRVSVYLAVRRWYLTALSLLVLTVLDTLVVTRPAIGLGLAATPLLYVVWANSRYALRIVLEPPRELAVPR